MKKAFMLILYMSVLLLFAGCGQEKLNIGKESSVVEGTAFDVKMEVVEGSVKPGSLAVCIKNNTNLEIKSGNEYDFAIEVLDKETWHVIETGERANTAEAFVFKGERTLDIDWSNIYGPLPSGHYRIVKYFFPWTEDGSYGIKDGFYLTAEFNIE